MKRFLYPVVLVFLLVPLTSAQKAKDRFTQPSVPSRETLDQLNLKLGWKAAIPLKDKRDGLDSVQITGGQLLVQTRSGGIVLLDAEDGTTIWRTAIGEYHEVTCPPGYNETMIFATRATTVFFLDRKTGKQIWEKDVPRCPAAQPVGDHEAVFIVTGTGHVQALAFPKINPGDPKTEIMFVVDQATGVNVRREVPIRIEPKDLFSFQCSEFVSAKPLYGVEHIGVLTAKGSLMVISPFENKLLKEFQLEAGITAHGGQFEEMVYVPSLDYFVHAINMKFEKVVWRYSGGSAIARKPEVTDDNVYVVPEKGGLVRLSRDKGDEVWKNVDARRFLAENKKFVYAMDKDGKLMVLDRDRGKRLGGCDTQDFVFPIANEWTDRLYLAAQDGLIVCLHDRDNVKPLVTKKAYDVIPIPKKEKVPVMPAPGR